MINTKFLLIVMSLSSGDIFCLENKNIVDRFDEVYIIVGTYVFLIFMAYSKWLPSEIPNQNL